MKKGRLLLLAIVLVVLCPSPVMAWGPITHLEIAHMQGYTGMSGECYQSGSILPDFSLAYRMKDSSYPNLQSVTHTDEFVAALREIAHKDFCDGWQAHLDADKVESLYSRERIADGAPESADWVVDQAYAEDMKDNAPWFIPAYQVWIDYALDAVGCEVDCPKWQMLDALYSGYIGGYQPNKEHYQEVLVEWYSDYQEYVDIATFGEPDDGGKDTSDMNTEKDIEEYNESHGWLDSVPF